MVVKLHIEIDGKELGPFVPSLYKLNFWHLPDRQLFHENNLHTSKTNILPAHGIPVMYPLLKIQ